MSNAKRRRLIGVPAQVALSAVALYLIGLPYPLALGAWVSITAVIPYLGAWLGAVPAVLVAFSISPTEVVLTALVFLAIQQLEGNFLTPRIQGQAIEVPSNEHTCNNNPNTDLDGTVVCESKASSRVETPDPELT
jgi:ABC-type uncharacterized transport system permease subunit